MRKSLQNYRILKQRSRNTQRLIHSIENAAAGLPVSKSLIENKSNDSEENEDEEKEPIDTEFTEQKADPENDENAIDFRWSDVQEEDEVDIDKATLLRAYKSKLMRQIFKKWNWGLFDDFGIVTEEKIS